MSWLSKGLRKAGRVVRSAGSKILKPVVPGGLGAVGALAVGGIATALAPVAGAMIHRAAVGAGRAIGGISSKVEGTEQVGTVALGAAAVAAAEEEAEQRAGREARPVPQVIGGFTGREIAVGLAAQTAAGGGAPGGQLVKVMGAGIGLALLFKIFGGR